jgi:hypothetical protein
MRQIENIPSFMDKNSLIPPPVEIVAIAQRQWVHRQVPRMCVCLMTIYVTEGYLNVI